MSAVGCGGDGLRPPYRLLLRMPPRYSVLLALPQRPRYALLLGLPRYAHLPGWPHDMLLLPACQRLVLLVSGVGTVVRNKRCQEQGAYKRLEEVRSAQWLESSLTSALLSSCMLLA